MVDLKPPRHTPTLHFPAIHFGRAPRSERPGPCWAISDPLAGIVRSAQDLVTSGGATINGMIFEACRPRNS
jgi:hypothetical protein